MLCKQCGVDKPPQKFPLDNGGRRRSRCRNCVRSSRLQRGRCQCNRPIEFGTRCASCREGHRKNSEDRRKRDKHAALKTYGGRCMYCGEDREIFLTIDHKNNDGAHHRRQLNKNRGHVIYGWLRQNDYPQGFQTACFNCNCAKSIVGEAQLCLVLGINLPAPDATPDYH